MDHWVPEALGQLDLDSLIGLSVAEARALVEGAGGRLRAVRRDQAFDLSYSPGRVTVSIEDDRVTSVLGLEGGIAEHHVPTELARLDLEHLVGVDIAEARAQVQDAGGELVVLTSWNVPFDVRPWRITVRLAGNRVVEVVGRG